jgi:tripartite-type tricarboxylate transporter receptor subunit TctC
MPTMKEQGVDIEFAVNRGVCAPLKTPKSVVNKLAAVFQKTAEDPEFVKKISDLGSLVVYRSPKEYKAYTDRSTETWSQLAKEIGLKKKKK